MERAIQKRKRGPDAVADAILGRIFTGELAPGSRLPPERRLAEELGTDRTTLRMALTQLQRMNLLVPRQGSGSEVRDFRVHGGIDVLAALFATPDLPLEGSFIVEALDFWLDTFSLIAGKAVVRMTLDDLRSLELSVEDGLAARDDPEAAVACLIALQDAIVAVSGSVLFRMLQNSTRPLRERIVRMLPRTIDVPAWLETIRDLLRNAALHRPPEEIIRANVSQALAELTGKLREELLFGHPPSSKDKP